MPASEQARMRAPFQVGDFPFPVKYGYALVGEADRGTVFALHPHQSRAVLPSDALVAVPDTVPARRATLAANMETALNVVWDAGVSAGDRVLVVGAGVVGLLIAYLAARFPGTAVSVTDVNPMRNDVVRHLGAAFSPPDAVPGDMDIAINASGAGEGLAAALAATGAEGRVVEASWLGTGETALALGGSFHSGRLTITSSQVGRLPPPRAPRWSHRRRLEAAMAMLADPALDALISHVVPFEDAPQALPPLLDAPDVLAVILDYG